MIFELYDWDNANLIAVFPTETAALTEVREQMTAFGRDSVRTWTLLRSAPDGTRKEGIAQGNALADLALYRHVGAAD